MKLLLKDGSVWTAHFYHKDLPEHPVLDNGHKIKARTTCRLHPGNCQHVGERDSCIREGVYMGHSHCSVNDNFCLADGRFIALMRALDGVDYELKNGLMSAYFRISPASKMHVTAIRLPDHTHYAT